MPRYEKQGGDVVETSNAVEGVRLQAAGYAVVTARTKAVREVDADNPAVPEDVKPKS